MDPLVTAGLLGLTLLASILGTATGFGTSTVMVPVMSLFFPLSQTLVFVGVVHLFGDVWKVALFRRGLDWRLIALFGVPGVAAGYFGASLAVSGQGPELKRLLGLFLLAYVGFLFLHRNWSLPKRPATAIAGGALSGLFAGFFGVGGAVRSTFLTAYALDKAVFICTSGAIALFIDAARIWGYLEGGVFPDGRLGLVLILCVPVSLLGAWLARAGVSRLPQALFRPLVAGCIALAALKLVFRP